MHFQSMKYKDIVHCWNCQNSHSLLLPQHAAPSTHSRSQDPAPSTSWGTSCRAVLHITHQGKQKKEAGSDVCPPHNPCYGFSVDRMGRKQQTCYQGPVPIPKEDPGEVCEKACDCSMQQYVYKVVAPWVHPSNSMVDAEGERAERSVWLVAPTVSEKCSPEVIVEYMRPRRLWQKILVCLDGSAIKDKNSISIEGKGYKWKAMKM